jgi:hypothetical protein
MKELHDIVSRRVSGLRFDIDATLRVIDGITAAVKSGDATHATELPELSTRLAEQKRQLISEEQSLRVAERDLTEARKVAQERELEELITLAEKTHTQFADLFRRACIALGDICSIIETAAGLGNALALPLRGCPMRDRLARVAMPPDDLLPKLLDTGLQPMPGVGFNWAVRVIPLRDKFSKSQEEVCETNNSK